MKLLEQIATIFAVYLISLGIVEILPFTIPVSITSMIVLFILLFFKLIKEKQIQETADFLLKNMAFFFIPAGVGIMEYFDILKSQLIPFLVICLLTTIITFFVTAFTVNLVIKMQGGSHE